MFKIQANMDKNHRDRIAFVRICSGKFERGMEAFHVQGGKKLKLATGTSLMADDRATVDEAFAGDIVGLFDPGIFSIGDTVCKGEHVQFPPIPTFSPEHFARITQVNTLEAQAVRQGHARAGARRRRADLPRAGFRHGKRHLPAWWACFSSTCWKRA